MVAATDLAQGFVLGIVNPLLVPTHLLSVIGLALLVARNRAAMVPLVVFAVALAGGLAALSAAVGATPARNVLLAAGALSGLAVAVAVTAPRAVVALLSAMTGIALGLDSPPATVSIVVGNAMLGGTWVGAGVLLAAVASCASRVTRPWQQIALRVLGSWIAASAILALALRLVR
jgi:hypothetical protein